MFFLLFFLMYDDMLFSALAYIEPAKLRLFFHICNFFFTFIPFSAFPLLLRHFSCRYSCRFSFCCFFRCSCSCYVLRLCILALPLFLFFFALAMFSDSAVVSVLFCFCSVLRLCRCFYSFLLLLCSQTLLLFLPCHYRITTVSATLLVPSQFPHSSLAVPSQPLLVSSQPLFLLFFFLCPYFPFFFSQPVRVGSRSRVQIIFERNRRNFFRLVYKQESRLCSEKEKRNPRF